MKQLANKEKSFILTFKHSSNRESEMITSAEAYGIIDALQNKTLRYIERSNDDGSFKEVLDKGDIKGVSKQNEENEYKNAVWICDCGIRNPMSVWPASQCECKGKGAFEKMTGKKYYN